MFNVFKNLGSHDDHNISMFINLFHNTNIAIDKLLSKFSYIFIHDSTFYILLLLNKGSFLLSILKFIYIYSIIFKTKAGAYKITFRFFCASINLIISELLI